MGGEALRIRGKTLQVEGVASNPPPAHTLALCLMRLLSPSVCLPPPSPPPQCLMLIARNPPPTGWALPAKTSPCMVRHDAGSPPEHCAIKTTLIIAPANLMKQWGDELVKHFEVAEVWMGGQKLGDYVGEGRKGVPSPLPLSRLISPPAHPLFLPGLRPDLDLAPRPAQRHGAIVPRLP